MATLVMYRDLDKTHSMTNYDRVLENSPEHPNDRVKETVVWERFNPDSLEKNENIELPRDLLVIAKSDEDVRTRLKELGYIFDD